jgi:hypothetical protein
MPQLSALDYLMDDLSGFITKKYTMELPNSLLIAQAFILLYPVYGREYGLPVINKAIEEGIKQNLF